MPKYSCVDDFDEDYDEDLQKDIDFDKLLVFYYRKNLAKRVLVLNQYITHKVVDLYTSRLLELDEMSHDPITVYINSCGGEMYEGINLYDVMSCMKSPVTTICLAYAMSSGFVIFMGGDKRIVYPNSVLIMHSITTWLSGENVPSVLTEASQLENITNRLSKEFSLRTDKSVNWWKKDVLMGASDTYLFPEDAIKYGIVTNVIQQKKGNQPVCSNQYKKKK